MKKDDGFTLIEVLISLFIFSSIAIVISQALRVMIENQKNLDQKVHVLYQLKNTLQVLEQDVSQILPRPAFIDEHVYPALQQQVGEKKISFSRAGYFVSGVNQTGLARVVYTVKNKNLIRQVWYEIDHTATHPPEQTQILLNNLSDMQFQFIDQQKKRLVGWEKTSDLPLAIEITMTLSTNKKFYRLILLPGFHDDT